MYTKLILVFLISVLLTLIIQWIIQKHGGGLYTPIRGGNPRAVGIAPFIAMIIFIPQPYSYLIGIIGIFALFDDIIGRKKIKGLPFEIGQLSRGLGMLLVAFIGFFYFGPAALLIALMIQPINISDMQPGSACTTVITMCILLILSMFLTGYTDYYIPLVILAACIGYAPLDYRGKIMMGEIGNHSFAIGLGISYALLGGFLGNIWGIGYYIGYFIGVLVLFIVSSIIIALIRRKNLKIFLRERLKIENPHFGDYVMDVMTGGGFGDLFRRIIIRKKQYEIKNKFLMFLGFRRLFYNPYSKN
ncbi:cell wall biosynthesis protein [Methanobacterium sp. ACI-7]|uniref:cell wall biosynthesis protein n=1 Tax=unclassified Methanobacterium TaxID=2627676 RepID=UPI0039C41849